MRIYFDPSVLISLYVAEAAGALVQEFLEDQDTNILLNQLQEFELKNGVRQKLMRKEITEAMAARSLRLLDDDFVQGRVVAKPVNWDAVYGKAEVLSRRLSAKRICRATDLLHVAICLASRVRDFATFDEGQAKLAAAAGLRLVRFE